MVKTKTIANQSVIKSGLLIILPALLIAGLFPAALFPSDTAGKSPVVRIGVLAHRGAEEALRMWGPTADYLKRTIPDYSFSVIPLDFQKIGPAVGRGEVDFVLANTSIYVELEARYGIARIATLKNKSFKGAYTVFGGVIFCRADRSDIRELTDLKGKSFMAVDETSFGGWRVAWRELKDHGVNPFRDPASLRFAGTHDAVVYAVRDGKADAGTVRTDTLERMAEEGKISLSAFHVLYRQSSSHFPFLLSTRLYPEWPFARTKRTSDDLSKKVAIALLSMPSDSPAAKAGKIAGWTTPLDYQPVHDLMKELRVGPYRDYGRIALGTAVRMYWYWVALAAAAILLMAVATLHAIRLNRRLRQSRWELEQARAGLEKQVRERTATLENQHEALKKSEEALRQSETRFRGLVEQSLVGIYIINSAGKFIYVNPKLAEIFGYDTQHEIVFSKAVTDLVAPESLSLVAENVRKRLQGEMTSTHYFFKGLRKDDVVINVETYGTRMEIDGRPAVIGTLLDVTKQKRAEEEREETRKFLQSVIDGVDESIMVIDPDHRVILMNRPAKEFAPPNTYCYHISHRRDVPCIAKDQDCPLRTVITTRQPVTVIHTHIRGDGTEGHVEILASPIFDKRGKVIYVVEAARDITEKLALEKMQRKMQERLFQQQKEQSIITLAGGIAHDFNNILMGVIGSAEILKQRCASGQREQDLADTIIDLSRRMAHLTRQLLAYAKQGAYEQKAVTLGDAVEQAVDLTHKGRSSAIEVRMELPEDLWPVFADPGQMNQVLINLLSNAFEAMEESGGCLTVKGENISNAGTWECSLNHHHPGGDYVHLTVSDTGPGIPPDTLKRIFEPFFTTKFMGRGLGLAAALGIIQNHNGCISAASEEGKGATFHLYLPRFGAAEERKKAGQKAPVLGKILVVEDEPEILSLLRMMLAELGFETILAGNGAEALKIFAEEKKDIRLAILDIQMPGMDGKKLFRELKSLKPGLKILVSSGYDEKTALAGIGPLQPDGFIQKPYWIDSLREKMQEILFRE